MEGCGAAPFVVRTGPAFDDVSGLTDGQRARARQGYGNLAGWVRRTHEAGSAEPASRGPRPLPPN